MLVTSALSCLAKFVARAHQDFQEAFDKPCSLDSPRERSQVE